MTKHFISGVLFLIFFALFPANNRAQEKSTPLEKAGFTRLTTYQAMMDFLQQLLHGNKQMQIEFIATSAQGKNLPVIKISRKEFGTDSTKACVLIFAQQHGNEPSGKEAALMLIRNFAQGNLDYLLDSLDIAIVPMMNPDGNDMNTRRNGNDADLNRDHLALLQPESAGLHAFFNKYNFIASMDVHEYSPYSDDWLNFGYLKNFDVQVGRLTNINTPPSIRSRQQDFFYPYIQEYIEKAGYSFHDYLLGGPPGVERLRHSTYDINDGRQSFGSSGTFSIIQEGINGKDSADRIEHRSKSQLAGIMGFLEYIYSRKPSLTALVQSARHAMSRTGTKYGAVQMEHVSRGTTLPLTLKSVTTGADTLVIAADYRPVVENRKSVSLPFGYLIPASQPLLVDWAKRHGFPMEKYVVEKNDIFEIYHFEGQDTINFEGDTVYIPEVKKVRGQALGSSQIVYLLPVNNKFGYFLLQALEPQSSIGLGTYKSFSAAFANKPIWPVIRLIRNAGGQ